MTHFSLFKKKCQYWIDRLELNNITFYFHNGLKPEDKDDGVEGACIYTNIKNCQVDIYYDNRDKNQKSIKQSAKHEILHALLMKLSLLGKGRQFTFQEYEREEEELVHKLEKIIT